MKRSRARSGLPLAVRRALAKLGEDLSVARRRRRITMATLAERAFISRATLARVERGDAGVSMGIYATVLFVLGMLDRVSSLADAATDRLGQALEEEHLPKRVRVPRARSGDGA
jgi:transcriptional regulator with XRE-family HTH domain